MHTASSRFGPVTNLPKLLGDKHYVRSLIDLTFYESVEYSGRSIESALLNHSLAAIGRNGHRCIHFITATFIAMSDADMGAKRSTLFGVKRIRGAQFSGEDVGAHQCQAGAHAAERRGAVPGVTHKRYPARHPSRHVHVEERVEVEVVGLLRGG